MLNINFEVNKNFILRGIIQRSLMLTALANHLWDKYNDSYRMLKEDILSKDIDFNILEEIKQQPFFNEILQETQKNCERIKNNWENKQREINDFLSIIAKTDFLLETIAYILPPSVCVGRNIGDNCFLWGHKIGVEDENYDLVYLVHESLHSMFPRDDVSHAIIENIADIELCKYLNKTKVGYETHKKKEIQEAHAQILPYWNLYLNKSEEEIKEEQELLNINYDISEYEPFRERISKMNIVEFTNFVLELNANKV